MFAVVASQPGGPEILDVVDIDIPMPGPGQVLIRVAAAKASRLGDWATASVLFSPAVDTPSMPLPKALTCSRFSVA